MTPKVPYYSRNETQMPIMNIVLNTNMSPLRGGSPVRELNVLYKASKRGAPVQATQVTPLSQDPLSVCVVLA